MENFTNQIKIMSNTVIAGNIPIDVMVEILARVPVKSLLRFKCVRKSWYSLIRSPSFIAKQLRYASTIEDNYSAIIKHGIFSSSQIEISFLPDRKDSSSSSFVNVNDLSIDDPVHIPFFDDEFHELGKIPVRFHGPCNGVICALGDHPTKNQHKDDSLIYTVDAGATKNEHRRGDLIALWNPATREMKRLPLSEFPQCPEAMSGAVGIGFGFDSSTKDYKVVRILDYRDEAMRLKPLVEVYNLSTNTWRKMDVVVPMWPFLQSIYLDGFCYWYSGAYNGHAGRFFDAILCFDFVNEVFVDTLLPLPYLEGAICSISREKFRSRITFLKYEESVALLACDCDSTGWTSTSLWVLERDGNKNTTWSRLYKVMNPYLDVLGFLRNEIALILHDYDYDTRGYKLIWYDVSTQQVLHRRSYGNGFDQVYHYGHVQLVNYVQSLVTFEESVEFDDRQKMKRDLDNSTTLRVEPTQPNQRHVDSLS